MFFQIKMSEKTNLGDEIYSGAASFGIAWALIGAIFATIIGIGMIVGGIYILIHKDKLIDIQATITQINGGSGPCSKITDNPIQYSCSITLEYKYNGITYTGVQNYTGNANYYIGEVITIRINPNNPNDISLNNPIPKWIGWILIVFALLIIIGSWFWYWASRKWKFVAAAEGVGGALNIISGGRI